MKKKVLKNNDFKPLRIADVSIIADDLTYKFLIHNNIIGRSRITVMQIVNLLDV